MEYQTLIDVDSLRELLGGPGLAIVDCRFDLMNPEAGRGAYLRAHIPGACYAGLDRDLSGPVGPDTGRHPLPSPEVFAAWLGSIGIGNNTQVIAYDEMNGSIAARLWWMLRWLGARAVAVLDGGFQAWTVGGGALESGESALPPQQFTPRIGANGFAARTVSTAELEHGLRDAKSLLVDARAAPRFAGTAEPIDSVAGHVPGAVNHPFTANLAADGRFLPAAELKSRWQERLQDTAAADLVAMCGSGVTACHNLLALEVAGLPGGRLYAGSWSEWIRDPRRPVARG